MIIKQERNFSSSLFSWNDRIFPPFRNGEWLKLFLLDLDTQATRAIMYETAARIRFRKMDLKRSIDARVVRAWLPAVSGERIQWWVFDADSLPFSRKHYDSEDIRGLRLFSDTIVIVFNDQRDWWLPFGFMKYKRFINFIYEVELLYVHASSKIWRQFRFLLLQD